MYDSLQLISLKSTHDYATRVFNELCLFPEFYSQYQSTPPHCLDVKHFADGELEISISTTLRGKDIVFFACSGRSYYEPDPSKAKMMMYHALDSIKRAQPRRVILFEPYCSSARSDRTMGRNSVGVWLHFQFLTTLGVNTMLTYQLHSDQSKTIMDPTKISLEDVPVTLQLMEYIASHYIKSIDYFSEYIKENWLFCSVDAGGEGFARKFAVAFQTGLITAYKQRNYAKINTVDSVNILTATNLEGKEIWIVDDMIDTGGSMEATIRTLATHKVKKVHVAVVHPVFSRPSLERINRLYEQGLLSTLLVFDTIPHEPDYDKKFPFMRIVPSEQLSAQIILRIHEEKSLSPFFEDFNINKYLLQLPYRQ